MGRFPNPDPLQSRLINIHTPNIYTQPQRSYRTNMVDSVEKSSVPGWEGTQLSAVHGGCSSLIQAEVLPIDQLPNPMFRSTLNTAAFLPKFHQHVNFATRGANALDLVYTNIPSAYRAEPRPHLGYSDHISVMLIPAYRPLLRRSKPVLKQVRTWPSGAISALQDCFEHTDWQMLREAATYSTTTDLEEYTSSVTSYISKCIDDVTVSKTITTRPNQKPWMTAEVRSLLKARDSAFKTGDKAALRKAKLSRAIREAKRAHGQSVHSHFRDSGDARRMWQSIQAITNYRTAPPACDSDASLPDALNHFYMRDYSLVLCCILGLEDTETRRTSHNRAGRCPGRGGWEETYISLRLTYIGEHSQDDTAAGARRQPGSRSKTLRSSRLAVEDQIGRLSSPKRFCCSIDL
ncbi:hypothetical protein NFI96_003285 [Prochilodus magdalenae]|nr:hypothetical protein NFI96_003285 [Prochilodus magdalenae]